MTAVLEKLGDVLRPAAVKAIVEGVLAALHAPTLARDRARVKRDLSALDTEIARLTEAIATGGGTLPSLLTALKARQEHRTTLATEIAAQTAVDVTRLDRRTIEQRAHRRFAECRARLDGTVATTRKVLREILMSPLVLTPTGRGYQFAGEAAVESVLFGETEMQLILARPEGLEPSTPGLEGRCSIQLSYGRSSDHRSRGCSGGVPSVISAAAATGDS